MGTDGEACSHPQRALEEFAMRHAVRLVDLDRDVGVATQLDELLLPRHGIHALRIPKSREGRHRPMAEDVDPVTLEARPDDLEHALADAARQCLVNESVALQERRALALEELARVVERDPYSVDL